MSQVLVVLTITKAVDGSWRQRIDDESLRRNIAAELEDSEKQEERRLAYELLRPVALAWRDREELKKEFGPYQ